MKPIYRLYVIGIFLFLPLFVNAQMLDAMVKETTNKVLEQLQRNRDRLEADPESIQQVVHQLIVPHFDFETMSDLVMGSSDLPPVTVPLSKLGFGFN